MNADKLNEFMINQEAEDIKKFNEEGTKVRLAVERLMDNEDFKLVYKYYTVDDPEIAMMNAVADPENRAMYFERILNRKAFQAFIEEALAFVEAPLPSEA